MEGPTTKLAEVISTRISHDLIGNIGAIGNAVELLEEGDMDFLSDIKNILKISSSVLSNRLKFFRMAFGLENSNIEDAIQVEKVSQAYIKTIGSGEGNGISLRMSLENKAYNREAMLTVMILVDTIIKGGEIEIISTAKELTARVSSQRGLSEEKINTLEKIWQGEVPDNKAIYAGGLYLYELGREKGHHITQSQEKGFTIRIE